MPSNSRLWTKNTLLRQIIAELNENGLTLELRGNEIILYGGDEKIAIEFGASNYADDNKVELIASIYLEANGQYRTWESLFDVCKEYHGKKYRALTIYKDEKWEGSNIQKECREIYTPLFQMMQDPEKLEMMKEGKKFRLGNKDMNLWPVNF